MLILWLLEELLRESCLHTLVISKLVVNIGELLVTGLKVKRMIYFCIPLKVDV